VEEEKQPVNNGQWKEKTMRDFTLKAYERLLAELTRAGYGFAAFAEYIEGPGKKGKTIILRHDVDKKPLHSLRTAEMENKRGIKATYYFRVIKNELPKEVIEHVAKLGHEIGYHYDDLNVANGVVASALDSFQKNLAGLRKLAPVKTACMHGSPLSRHDNRRMWKVRNYREFGIIGEPYFDIDFDEVFYLTDTGRMWDGNKFSIRDKVRGRGGAACNPPALCLHSTMDIIEAVKNNRLPDKVMLTIHPQRWTGSYFHWLQELLWQKFKNLLKYVKLKKMEKIDKK
jgi:hypothetical protein